MFSNDYGFSDSVRRQQRERLGYQQPLYVNPSEGMKWWHWAVCGAVLALIVVLA